MMKLVQSALKALAGEAFVLNPENLAIGDSDIYMFFDAMKHQQEKAFSDCFTHADTKIPKVKKHYYVIYDEEGLRKKGKSERGNVHEATELDCVEYLQCLTSGDLKIRSLKRKRYDGTNQSNQIGPVTYSPDRQWKLTFGEKKELLGSRRVDVGGPDKDGPGRGHKHRLDTDVELMSFHGNTHDFWAEICHSFCLESAPSSDDRDHVVPMSRSLSKAPNVRTCIFTRCLFVCSGELNGCSSPSTFSAMCSRAHSKTSVLKRGSHVHW